jgi:predicted PurR-regulated permease PerM
MRLKLLFSLGSIAAILLVSGLISIIEYRRMSDYVSNLIASNIKSINLSQRLADMTQEYNHQMLAVVVQNDISRMPQFDFEDFKNQADSLKNSFTSQAALPMVDSVEVSFDAFMKTSLMFDSVFLADNVDTGEWFFGTLQPRYQEFREDMNVLNEAIYNDLLSNSSDFDAGFYRSIMPGVVSVGAGLLLIMLLLFFALTNYVIPIKRIAEGINSYRSYGKKYTYQFEGDDQLAEINTGVTEILEENVELLARIKALREGIEKTAE